MEIFEKTEIIKILKAIGMPGSRVLNWTRDWEDKRTLRIKGSIKVGARALYSENDVYKIGLAFELRKAGMAAKPIGNILNAIKKDLKKIRWLTISRKNEKTAFRVMEGRAPHTKNMVWLTIRIKALVDLLKKGITLQVKEREKLSTQD